MVEGTITADVPTATLPVVPTESATMPPTAVSPEILSQNPTSVPGHEPTWIEDLTTSDLPHFENPGMATSENTSVDGPQQGERDRSLGLDVPSGILAVEDVPSLPHHGAVRPRDGREAGERTASTVSVHVGAAATDRDLQPDPNPMLPEEIPPAPPSNTNQPPALAGKTLVVDQDIQALRVYEDGVEIRTLPVSTGVPPLYTPAFRGRVGHYAGTIYGYGSWTDNAWYVFTAGGNIYIHSAPYSLSGDVKAYEGLESLGVRPSSHGCIRLYPADAEWLTAWNPAGVPILVTPLDLDKEW